MDKSFKIYDTKWHCTGNPYESALDSLKMSWEEKKKQKVNIATCMLKMVLSLSSILVQDISGQKNEARNIDKIQ